MTSLESFGNKLAGSQIADLETPGRPQAAAESGLAIGFGISDGKYPWQRPTKKVVRIKLRKKNVIMEMRKPNIIKNERWETKDL